ncbi:uncharacterized protein N7496_002643 [Penicillium cataractarum]|uniref:CYTH domain-containing protein n=1 Tax=Penicillium cataractarum TaxID=2100454 RepID=A0A9W9VI27_9EURO|nr:uncharacterized protein N7496_002643 [Penicillium cataractarum]KAJ5380215.1 hypothetical protein N7496_002643 [Penicillium cataractarum]
MSRPQAVSNMVPDYEVRLLLNPTAVLSAEHDLVATVLSAFEMPLISTKMNIQFLDNSLKELYAANWSARIRKVENEDNLELTYKKRYAIIGGHVEAALTAANNDDFNAGDAKYEAQVEWGYQKQTLSVSRKKMVADPGRTGMDLPGTSNSRQLLIDNAPNKFDNWRPNKWGTSTLSVSRIFGPVFARRSVGLWNDMTLYLEIWPLLNVEGTGVEYTVEASFKTKSHKKASCEQANLATYLQSKGWLLAQDSLKTQLIMERY